MILADTDVLIDFLAGVPAVVTRLTALIRAEQLQTTVINSFELLSGRQEGRKADRLQKLLASLPILPLDPKAAERAAEVRQMLERTGQTIGMGDSLIAGIALSHKLPLLTRNRRHFARVAKLELSAIETTM